MTAKEKAKELVEKYMPLVYCYLGSGMLANEYDESVAKYNAKQCALIAVEEILKGDHLIRTPLSFWQQVKEEIEKL
jgi:hypothetical protein